MEQTPKTPHLSATCPVCGTTGYEANQPCPLHAAAPELLKALEACRSEIMRTAVLYADKIRTEMNPVHMADAAIKAAKGDA